MSTHKCWAKANDSWLKKRHIIKLKANTLLYYIVVSLFLLRSNIPGRCVNLSLKVRKYQFYSGCNLDSSILSLTIISGYELDILG